MPNGESNDYLDIDVISSISNAFQCCLQHFDYQLHVVLNPMSINDNPFFTIHCLSWLNAPQKIVQSQLRSRIGTSLFSLILSQCREVIEYISFFSYYILCYPKSSVKFNMKVAHNNTFIYCGGLGLGIKYAHYPGV